jgi:hypothetical protein
MNIKKHDEIPAATKLLHYTNDAELPCLAGIIFLVILNCLAYLRTDQIKFIYTHIPCNNKHLFMKTQLLTSLLAFALLFSSCQKEVSFEGLASTEDDSTDIRSNTLGTWDESGKPNYLLSRDNISANLSSFLNNSLPDADLRSSNPGLLANNQLADIQLDRRSDVYITFVSQGSIALRNTLSFYTYPTNSPPTTKDDIKLITCIFPNAGFETPLIPGDKVKIGRFNAGISIGFVLLRDSWKLPNHVIDSTVTHFYSTNALNPESDPLLKKHVVLVSFAPEKKVLVGFEDVDRSSPNCDHDFNDVVFYATVTPN